MGCGASADRRRLQPDKAASGTRDPETLSNSGRNESTVGRTNSASIANGHASIAGNGSMSPHTGSLSGAALKVPPAATHVFTDSKGYRVTSHISSKSKVDSLVRWADAVICNKPCDGGWRNPQELARELKKPVEEPVAPKVIGSQTNTVLTSNGASSSSIATLGSRADMYLSPSSPAAMTGQSSSEVATGRSGGAGASMQVQGATASQAAIGDYSPVTTPQTPWPEEGKERRIDSADPLQLDSIDDGSPLVPTRNAAAAPAGGESGSSKGAEKRTAPPGTPPPAGLDSGPATPSK